MEKLKPLYGYSLFLILVLILLSVWVSPTKSELICSGEECRRNTFINGKNLDQNLVQTFEVKIKVSIDRPQFFADDFKSNDKGIGLSWNKERQLSITIPMRYGSSTAFSYKTPKDLDFNDLRIRIEKSESLYIFLDEKIAYSHRYENSPFFVNYQSPVNTPVVAGKVIFSPTVVEEFLESKVNPFPRSASIVLILGLFAFTTAKLLNKLFPTSQSASMSQYPVPKSLYGLVGMSWGLTTLSWIRNPIDTTGAVNPGPFGPIGAAFSDFYQLSQVSQFDRPYDLGSTNYPPSGILLLRALSFYDPNNLSFFPIAGVILGAVYFFFIGSLKKKAAGIIFLGSFPLVFGIVRGNLDLLAVSLVWISIVSWKKEKYIFAGTLLAIAVAIKIWPIVFLLIFLKKKNWLLICFTSFTVVTITLLSSFALGYSGISDVVNITSSGLFDQSGLGSYAFQNTFSVTSLLFFGHLAFMSKNPFNESQTKVDDALTFVNSISTSIVILMILILLLYFFFRAKKLSNEFLILSGIVLLIPIQSFTYRALIVLLYFYLRDNDVKVEIKFRSRNSSAKRVANVSSSEPSFLEKITIWCTIPLFAPTAFYFVPGTQFSSASIFQPLGLITFIGLAIYREQKKVAQI